MSLQLNYSLKISIGLQLNEQYYVALQQLYPNSMYDQVSVKFCKAMLTLHFKKKDAFLTPKLF